MMFKGHTKVANMKDYMKFWVVFCVFFASVFGCYCFNMQAVFTSKKGGKGGTRGTKRRLRSSRKEGLAKARKKKAINAEDRKRDKSRKKLLKQRKKELMPQRKGKPSSLLCWAILFVGIINHLFLFLVKNERRIC